MRVFFGVASPYQLLNAIILCKTRYAEADCDVWLADFTEWDSEVLSRLRDKKIFGSVTVVECVEHQNRFLSENDQEGRRRIYTDPQSYFKGAEFAPFDYDVMCIGVAHLHWRMFYYDMVAHGITPEVWFLEEGVQSYTRDIRRQESSQGFSNGAYPNEVSFSKNILGIYLHRPELFSVEGSGTLKLEKLASPLEVEGLPGLLQDVFGHVDMPRQRFVYLEDFFYANALRTNDVQLVRNLASVVGSKNLIVKRHPRDRFDRFAPLGLTGYPVATAPWEVQLLDPQSCNKVLVSVTSTAMFSPYIVFDYQMHVISLEKMYVGDNPEYQDRAFVKFKKKLLDSINANGLFVHCPRTIEELEDTVRYLEIVVRDANQEGLDEA